MSEELQTTSIGDTTPNGNAELPTNPFWNTTENNSDSPIFPNDLHSSLGNTSTPESLDFSGTNSPIPLGEQLGQEKKSSDHFFLDDTTATEQNLAEVDDEKDKFVSKYIKRFLRSSIFTVINIVLLGIIFSYNLYITQASKVHVDSKYTNYVSSYKWYLGEISSLLDMNKEETYKSVLLLGVNDEANATRIINDQELSYIQKKDLLKDKVNSLMNSSISKALEIEETKKNIARFGFLPEEIRLILQEESAISSIQRSLNSLEVIKFTTALKVFSYMESVANRIADPLHMWVEEVLNILHTFSERGEKDVSAYVYMCYLNPFETSTECNRIGDFDLYYQDILKDKEFNRSLFKNIMKYVDSILEQEDVPSFSLLFNGFNAMEQTINFTIEVNTSRADELKLIARWIKSPHIFIFTNLINLLKQSAFIIGGEIDTKSIDITTRTLEIGSASYTVNTSTKAFSLPIQKTTEREIFDYIDIESLMKLDVPILETPEQISNEVWGEDSEEQNEETIEEVSDSNEEENQLLLDNENSELSSDLIEENDAIEILEVQDPIEVEEEFQEIEEENVTDTQTPHEEIWEEFIEEF